MAESATKTDGLKKTLHGCLYQWSLLTWVAIKASTESTENFELISEDSTFEKFDDLVIKYGEKRILFFQAKHSSKIVGTHDLKKGDFTASNGDACLAKYFDSWHRLETNYEHIEKRTYVFLTNRNVAACDSFLESFSDGDTISDFKLGGKTLKFKSNLSQHEREDFFSAIRAHSKVITSSFSDRINLHENDLEIANNYLLKKARENTTTHIDGRSNLSIKIRAIIKLAQTEISGLI